MAEKQKTTLGPTGETVRENVKRLRETQKLTYVELAERLAGVGRTIPVLGLRRIEKGERRVDADDLVALAVVLGVNPSALLLPYAAAGDAELTGAGTVSARQAWAWADGSGPLRIPEGDDGTARVDFRRTARPPGLRGWQEALASFVDTPELRRLAEAAERRMDGLTEEEREAYILRMARGESTD